MEVNVSKDKKVYEVEMGKPDLYSSSGKIIVLASDYPNACLIAENYLAKKLEHDSKNIDIVDGDGGIKKDPLPEHDYKIKAIKQISHEFIW